MRFRYIIDNNIQEREKKCPHGKIMFSFFCVCTCEIQKKSRAANRANLTVKPHTHTRAHPLARMQTNTYLQNKSKQKIDCQKIIVFFFCPSHQMVCAVLLTLLRLTNGIYHTHAQPTQNHLL